MTNTTPTRTVTVYAGSGIKVPAEFIEAAFELGKLIADEGWVQVNGGGSGGLMGACTRGAKSVGGSVDAVLLDCFVDESPDPTQFREYVVESTLSDRKRSLYTAGDAIVALPGGLGTLDELAEAICLRQHLAAGFDKPIVVVNTNGIFDGLRSYLNDAIDNMFIAKSMRDAVQFVGAPSEAIACIKNHSPLHIDKSSINGSDFHKDQAPHEQE